jgi:hypothetical protein
MKKHNLSTPQMLFLIGTRAALAAGAGLLVSEKLLKTFRRTLGLGLVAIGAATTFPAAKIALGKS